ncbi:acyl-CoA dehydrogenase family protein [Sphingobium sp. 3R8]|uniref:acyl-CoA dehydrogenase family protein n=1 Tax=Sphingobium sp. 3R8 TaxID=2874921 RepID=UPI001CCEFB7B|nr:acyl-CoA dehydrogenase family protein [Sphingobium sp. 3R8]MBZ9646889.1 acyl-CoA dehydrogenase family protein [Sphingobium sp. 3R8]
MNMLSGAYASDERLMIQEVARRFSDEVVLPAANRLDPERGNIPADLVETMGDLGFFGIVIPADLGGLGLGAFEYCLVAEELARGWLSVSSLMARGNSFYRSIPAMDAEDRRHKTELMAAGKYLGALAMSEPGVGSDVSGITCRAVRDGDDWAISGAKYWCTFADGADFLSVVCRTSDGFGKPQHGLSQIVIEKPRGQLPADTAGTPIPKIGYFGWKTWELAFDNARTPAAVQPYEEGRAFYEIASGLEMARAHTAARSIGCAQGAFDHATAYAQERVQFGQPIADFQSVRFKIATMATEIEAARQLMYYVADAIDSGRRCDREAAMVKLFAAEMAERVTTEALQILGGAGYTTLHPVERYWRDARLTKIFEGSSEIQQRIIADNILGKPRRAAA